MSFTLQAVLRANFNVTETADSTTSPGSSAIGATRYFDAYNLDTLLSAGSTPAPYAIVDLSFTLSGATKTFDLTAAPLARNVATTIDLTGKKLMGWLINVVSGNAAGVVLSEGASSPYYFLGVTTDRMTIFPGETIFGGVLAGSTLRRQAVAAGNKNVLFTGTAADVVRAFGLFG